MENLRETMGRDCLVANNNTFYLCMRLSICPFFVHVNFIHTHIFACSLWLTDFHLCCSVFRFTVMCCVILFVFIDDFSPCIGGKERVKKKTSYYAPFFLVRCLHLALNMHELREIYWKCLRISENGKLN